MRRRLNSFFICALIFFSACGSAEIEPAPIEPSDMCSFCRMAVSEKHFAAQIVTDDERFLKFDDIGCMLRFRRKSDGKAKILAHFVSGYDSGDWIKAEEAFFVKSKTVKTPMGSHILAFADKTKAEEHAAENGSRVLRFENLSAE
jgi:copper chaperone NosL